MGAIQAKSILWSKYVLILGKEVQFTITTLKSSLEFAPGGPKMHY